MDVADTHHARPLLLDLLAEPETLKDLQRARVEPVRLSIIEFRTALVKAPDGEAAVGIAAQDVEGLPVGGQRVSAQDRDSGMRRANHASCWTGADDGDVDVRDWRRVVLPRRRRR